MGADMTVQFLPSAEPTPERISRLHFLLDSVEDYAAVRAANADWLYDTVEEFRQGMRGYLAEWGQGLSGRRDACNIKPEGCPYFLDVTGGLSWGDDPTACYTLMQALTDFEPIYGQLREWAIEDEQERERSYRDRAAAAASVTA